MTQAYSRLLNVVLTKLWPPGVCSGSIKAEPMEVFDIRLQTGERGGRLLVISLENDD